MEGGDSEFAKFTVPSLKAHSQYVSGYRMQKTPHFFPTTSQSSGQPENDADTVSLLESGEHRYTKAISNDNNGFVRVCRILQG